MDELSSKLQVLLLAVGVGPSLLIAALAWWFRERLKHSLAQTLNAQTEQVKSAAQREMEAYKVTLIASIERQKAHAELKKALAVKHATLEYEALAALHGAVGQATALSLARATSPLPSSWTDQGRLTAYSESEPVIEAFSLAQEKARLFLRPQQSSACSQLSSTLSQLRVNLILKGSGPANLLEWQHVMTACTKIQAELRERVEVLTSIPTE